MCDRCGTVFSELDSGWQTYQATTTVEDDETGQRHQVTRTMDACRGCAIVPLTKTQRLERELGIGNQPDA